MTIQNDIYVTVFSDASWCQDTGAMGYAYWVKFGKPSRNFRDAATGLAKSSHHAELLGLQAAIDSLFERGVPLKDKIVVIQCDSTSALAHLRTKPLTDAGVIYVKKKHVKGHNGYQCPRSSVNTWCDKAARKAMRAHRTAIRNRAGGSLCGGQ